jgi:hypothetical protein
VSDPLRTILAAREQALLARAWRPEDAKTRFLVSLRRARGMTSGQLPLVVDLRDAQSLADIAVGGWSFAGKSGSWTSGPVAQLLVVPTEPPSGTGVVEFHIGEVLVNARHPTQMIAVDVNGGAEARWLFVHGQPWEPRRFVIVPKNAVERVSGFLISLRVHAPEQLQSLGMMHDTRSLGIALRCVVVRAAVDGGGPR